MLDTERSIQTPSCTRVIPQIIRRPRNVQLKPSPVPLTASSSASCSPPAQPSERSVRTGTRCGDPRPSIPRFFRRRTAPQGNRDLRKRQAERTLSSPRREANASPLRLRRFRATERRPKIRTGRIRQAPAPECPKTPRAGRKRYTEAEKPSSSGGWGSFLIILPITAAPRP